MKDATGAIAGLSSTRAASSSTAAVLITNIFVALQTPKVHHFPLLVQVLQDATGYQLSGLAECARVLPRIFDVNPRFVAIKQDDAVLVQVQSVGRRSVVHEKRFKEDQAPSHYNVDAEQPQRQHARLLVRAQDAVRA